MLDGRSSKIVIKADLFPAVIDGTDGRTGFVNKYFSRNETGRTSGNRSRYSINTSTAVSDHISSASSMATKWVEAFCIPALSLCAS